MNTEEIMDLALSLAGLKEIPDDSGIIVQGENIKKILIGVDMQTPELLLGKELGVDCVIGHHPAAGKPRIEFYKVMENQIDRMVKFGIPINKAQKVLKKRIGKVDRASHVTNYDRVSSAAKLLNMPYLSIHTPADILSENFVQKFLDENFKDKPKTTLEDIVEALKGIDEYSNAIAGPRIRVGSKKDYAGKIAVLMAGGTNGGADVYKAYYEAGVGTIVCMHVPEDVKEEVEKQNIGNIIVAGHMASDSIGLNIIIKELQNKGIEAIKMSGII